MEGRKRGWNSWSTFKADVVLYPKKVLSFRGKILPAVKLMEFVAALMISLKSVKRFFPNYPWNSKLLGSVFSTKMCVYFTASLDILQNRIYKV